MKGVDKTIELDVTQLSWEEATQQFQHLILGLEAVLRMNVCKTPIYLRVELQLQPGDEAVMTILGAERCRFCCIPFHSHHSMRIQTEQASLLQ
jgi:hypothetical protein